VPDKEPEAPEREQLWASLPKLCPMIEALAGGRFAGSDPERRLVQVLALVITTEFRFRDLGLSPLFPTLPQPRTRLRLPPAGALPNLLREPAQRCSRRRRL
jgi:hypothetical protein